MTIDDIKKYLRIDYDDEDSLLSSLNNAAEQYLYNSGAINLQGPLYDLAIKMLISHWYENRVAVNIGSISKELEFSLNSIITQLKYCEV